MNKYYLKKTINGIPNIYKLENFIGEGSNGFIFKAKHNNTGQKVAIKLLKPIQCFGNNTKFQMDCFYKEVYLYSKMNHPNIVKLIDKGVTNHKQPFFVFEFINGITLKDFISGQKKLSTSLVKEVMSQVLDAINHFSSKGVIHCDLKPQNIMITNNRLQKQVKIIDFGSSIMRKEIKQRQFKKVIRSNETQIKGTPTYCAPEQLRGETPSVKCDLYAWGLILIECLTGKTAIQGESITQIIQQQLSDQAVTIPSNILSHPIGSILEKVLKKNPSLRSDKPDLIYEEFLKTNLKTLDIWFASVTSTSKNQTYHTMINSLHGKNVFKQLKKISRQLESK